MTDRLRYGLAVAGYIALAMVTKQFLTWTYGPLYFVLVLEVLPRTWRRLRSLRGGQRPTTPGVEAVADR